MMKCVKSFRDGSVNRISNDKAYEYVERGMGKYIAKHEWKLYVGKWTEEKYNKERKKNEDQIREK